MSTLFISNRNFICSVVCVLLVFDVLIKVPLVSSDKKVKILLKKVASVAGAAVYNAIKEKEKYVPVPIPVPILPLIALAIKVKKMKESEYYLVKAIEKPIHYETVGQKIIKYLSI